MHPYDDRVSGGSEIRRRLLGSAPLPVLVGVSTVAHWLAGRRVHGLWILPDEAVYGHRAFAAWRDGPWSLLHGPSAGYGVLYPVLAGLPLSIGSPVTGYASLKLLQALVVSLAAVPVFVYGRRIMPARYALVAAVLTVASPLLFYAAFVMTEVLWYPLAALTLLAMVEAVATRSARAQAAALALVGACVLTRTQAVALVPVFGVGVLVDAALARDLRRVRRFWPVWVLLAGGAVLVAGSPSVLGAYSVTIGGGYPVMAAVRLTYEHLAYIGLAVGAAPLAALVLLTADLARRRERDARVRALVAVTISALSVFVVQVGFFAARYAPHLLGRDLAPLPPLLFLVLVTWAVRSSHRRVGETVAAAFSVLALVLLAPWNDAIEPGIFPDSFDAVIFQSIGASPEAIVSVFVTVTLAVFVLSSRRAPLVAALPILGALIAMSIAAVRTGAALANNTQVDTVGPVPDWLDRAASSDVLYVYGGEGAWTEVWQERFWNRRLTRVVSLSPARVPGPMPQTVVLPAPDGRVPGHERYAVAEDRIAMVGTPIAHLTVAGADISGLTLWRLKGRPRLATIEHNVQPNGDMTVPAQVTVYQCRGGRLELTLLPKATRTLTVLLGARVVLREHLADVPSWSGSVSAPRSRAPRVCTFTIVPQPLLGSTRLVYVPAG